MNKDKKLKIKYVCAFIATLLVFFSSVVYAWFSLQHKLGRMQEIVPPNAIFLSAAHRKSEVYFQLGEVNTSADATHKYYVFSISGVGIPYYKLMLAHTTNNPFTYSVYPATFSTTKPDGADGVNYVTFKAPAENTTGAPNSFNNISDITTGTVYYYSVPENATAISGSYLNKMEDSSPYLANDTKHSITYAPSDAVQKNAEPLYWQTGALQGDASNAFCHNYILCVDWAGATMWRVQVHSMWTNLIRSAVDTIKPIMKLARRSHIL